MAVPVKRSLLKLVRRLLMPQRGDLVSIAGREHGRRWRLWVPDDCVVGLCRELILQDIYAMGLAAGPTGTVIDAGAHVGSYALLTSLTAARVVALEADPENWRILKLNVFDNQVTNIEVLNVALWKTSGTINFQRASYSEGGAINATGNACAAAVSLDDLIDRYGTIDCLKIDIEGAEYEVLGHSTNLQQVRTIVGEMHVTDPQQEAGLVEHLRNEGFSVQTIPESDLSHPRNIVRVLRNWRRIDGHLAIKLAAIIYFLTGGRLGATALIASATPLFVATRG